MRKLQKNISITCECLNRHDTVTEARIICICLVTAPRLNVFRITAILVIYYKDIYIIRDM